MNKTYVLLLLSFLPLACSSAPPPASKLEHRLLQALCEEVELREDEFTAFLNSRNWYSKEQDTYKYCTEQQKTIREREHKERLRKWQEFSDKLRDGLPYDAPILKPTPTPFECSGDCV